MTRNTQKTYSELTQDELKSALHYDPASGVFTWIRSLRKAPLMNREAGSRSQAGYRVIRLNGTLYKAHRLAWLYVYGQWPKNSIDHINGNKLDNRIANLRDVPHAENMQNRRAPHANNTTGALGVSRSRNKYLAQLRIEGRVTYLGTFPSLSEAKTSYLAAKRLAHRGCTI